MTPPPLCIIQARLRSTRLEHKMLQTLGGETLIARAWRMAVSVFGEDDCKVAIPANDETGPLGDELHRIGAHVFPWVGPERDVLGRFVACAHRYRWHPGSVLFRWTGDDPFKSEKHVRRVLAGERLPVELGGEAFTLGMLDAAIGTASGDAVEHITYALFPVAPPPPPPGVWTIDTQEDLDAARAWLAAQEQPA